MIAGEAKNNSSAEPLVPPRAAAEAVVVGLRGVGVPPSSAPASALRSPTSPPPPNHSTRSAIRNITFNYSKPELQLQRTVNISYTKKWGIFCKVGFEFAPPPPPGATEASVAWSARERLIRSVIWLLRDSGSTSGQGCFLRLLRNRETGKRLPRPVGGSFRRCG